jgi:RNA polymerase sigma factor (sigma-70 family)
MEIVAVPDSGMFQFDPGSAPQGLRVAQVADAEDVEWLRLLYNANSDHIRDVIVRHGGPGMEPEDLVQEVFLAAHRKIRLLRTYAEPRAWLHLAALREVWKVRRRLRLRRFLPFGIASPASEEALPDAEYQRRETRASVHRMLDKLPRRQREALVLFHVEGLTSAEIGSLLGCPEETIRTRICYGRRTLMKVVRRQRRREEQRERGVR